MTSAGAPVRSRPAPVLAVLVVCHDSRPHIEACLSSVLDSDDGEVEKRVVVVDNRSQDGTPQLVSSHFPQVDLVESDENLGFAGGNNLGWRHVEQTYPEVEYLALLNHDTVVASGWLAPLVDYLDGNPAVGAVQPKILLHGEAGRINTVGTRCHYLGFGFMTAYRDLDRGQYETPRRIGAPSGAAVVIRRSLVELTGLFDEAFFMYLEDVDLGWRLTGAGMSSVCVPASVVFHKYRLDSDFGHYFFLERNRWLLLSSHYQWPTLLLLLPALLAMELGQLLFAARRRRLGDKLRAYRDLLRPSTLRHVRRQHHARQAARAIGDRERLAGLEAKLDFPAIDSPLVRYVANPLFGAYRWLVMPLIRW